ncbi:MAG: hypothetical protein F6K41_14840 [Symploca sp. SIO3E6]|nr:hypothetical protein [Caldora sp. SIO3E6]
MGEQSTSRRGDAGTHQTRRIEIPTKILFTPERTALYQDISVESLSLKLH